MKNNCYVVLSIVPVLTFACVLPGCREVDPPLSNYADLGEAGQPLLPTVPAVRDGRVKGGTAEWRAFEGPSEKGKKGANPKSAEAEEANAESDTNDADTIKEIEDLIAEYADVLDKKEYDAAVDFHIPEHRETAKKMYSIAKEGDKLSEDLKTLLIERLPNEKARIEKLYDRMDNNPDAKFAVTDLKISSDTEVTGKLPAIPEPIKFKLLRDKEKDADYWYMDSPILADYAKYGAVAEAIKTLFATQIEQVKAGASAEQSLAQLETLIAGIEAAMANPPTQPAPSDPASEEPRAKEAEKGD